MLALTGRAFNFCDGVSRRSFLKVGALGFGGMTLPQLLAHRAQAATKSPNSTSSPKTAVIFVELAGGPTHFETYDPKPSAPIEYRGPLGVAATNLPGVYLSELMTEQAKIMDKLAIIRSITHSSSSHGTSAHLGQTGYYLRDPQNRTNDMPSCGSITSKLRGPNTPGLPAYVSMPQTMRFGNAAYLGKAFNPFIVDGDPNAENFSVRNLTLEGGLEMARLSERKELLASLDNSRRLLDNEGVSAAMDQFTHQAFELVTSDAARKAFDLSAEGEQTRDRYGRHVTGQSLLLARRLVEAGVTFVTVRVSGWDDHGQIERSMRNKGPAYDRGLAALISDLYDRGLDRQVMVVSMGEFGRTPRINQNAGRDHWGSLMSVLMSGGGLRVGQIVGSSNSRGEVPQDHPYRPENVLATIYRHLGIDPQMTFNDLGGRPRYILERRELITELV